MRKNDNRDRHFNPYSKQQIQDLSEGDQDPLLETELLDGGEPISDQELDAIGDLGATDDDGRSSALLEELADKPPARLATLMRGVAHCLTALRGMRSTEAREWPRDGVAEAHWRALADEALGIIGEAAQRELDEQRLIQSMPEGERESFQRLCDSRRGLGVFRKGFEREREAWEQAYWKRGLDESFGKRPWTGPSGWRSPK